MNETVRKSVRIHLRFIMTKVINRKTSCFFSSSSTFMLSLSWYRRIHLEKWTVLTLMALTIVPVKVTMLDPFSHART